MAIVAGCNMMYGSSIVFAINESDQDVIVAVDLGSLYHWRLVPARSQGGVFTSTRPQPDWQLHVFDSHCRLLARLPFTAEEQTIEIRQSLDVDLKEGITSSDDPAIRGTQPQNYREPEGQRCPLD